MVVISLLAVSVFVVAAAVTVGVGVSLPLFCCWRMGLMSLLAVSVLSAGGCD